MLDILIVDDSILMRRLLSRILEQAGHNVLGEATNGLEAVHKYFELRPQLVMMDITMPILNGVEAVKLITAKDSTANIIMCSSMGQADMVKQAILYGAKDFIVKPFDGDRIIKSLQKLYNFAHAQNWGNESR